MKKSLTRVGALAAASLLALSACAQPPAETTSSAPADSKSSEASTEEGKGSTGDEKKFKACMVSDSGGFDDKSFNETSYKGLLRAKEELGIEIGQIESNAENEFAGNIQSQVEAGCNLIITVGFLLANATESAAKLHPDVHFAIVDYDSFKGVDNAKGLMFNAAQPAFLAGYAAAAVSETGKVGTFGGAKIPTVTIFMDGFDQGVRYYNKVKGKNVQVLGWNTDKGDGQFIAGNNPFDDIPGGKNTSNTLLSQGVDVIMPVAGPSGQGTLQLAKERGDKLKAIWVDTDGYVSAPDFKGSILTSVEKGMDVAVFDTIKASKEGNFSSEAYVGDLKNEGVRLSPFHDFEDKVPAELKKELEDVQAKIISGEIKIKSPLG